MANIQKRIRDLEARLGKMSSQMQSGIVGPTGPTGPDGNTGPTGPKGKRGDAGLTGPTGAPGKKGLSRVGPTGLDGKLGAKGLTGPQGDKGDSGKKGETGPTGKDGDPGENQKVNHKWTNALFPISASVISHTRQTVNASISIANAGVTGVAFRVTGVNLAFMVLSQCFFGGNYSLHGYFNKTDGNKGGVRGGIASAVLTSVGTLVVAAFARIMVVAVRGLWSGLCTFGTWLLSCFRSRN